MGKTGTTQNTKLYRQWTALEAIIEEMGYAMRRAKTDYVALGRPTQRMVDTLEKFYNWAAQQQ